MKVKYRTHRVLVKGNRYGNDYIPSALPQYYSVWRIKTKHFPDGDWVYHSQEAINWNLSSEDLKKFRGKLYEPYHDGYEDGNYKGKPVVVTTCVICGDEFIRLSDETFNKHCNFCKLFI